MTSKSTDLLRAAAYFMGVMVAVQRNRAGLDQESLANEFGIKQTEVSDLENGNPTGLSSGKIASIFKRIGLKDHDAQASFLEWWGKNGAKL